MKNLILSFSAFFISLSALAVCDGTSQTTTIPDPVNGAPMDIQARIYRPLASPNTKFPIVFILPPVVGETPLDGALAINFCLSGVGAYILDIPNSSTSAEAVQNLNAQEDALIRSEVSVNKLISDLATDTEISGKFGILGASQGGIISSYLAGAIPMLKSSVIIAGAGNVASILTESDQESVKKLRDDRMAFYQLTTPTEYDSLIRPYITLDPLFMTENIAADSMMLFVTTQDTEVPTKYQRELVSAVTTPKVIEINNTHVPGIVEASTLHADEILNFFKDRLK
jgi:dienelactone hydrolase